MKHTVLAILGALVLASHAAQAHHGYAGFFLDRTVVVEGDIEDLLYANPHVVMKIRAADSTLYTVAWQGRWWVEAYAGVKKTTFTVGDQVIMSAAPSRDPASHELAVVREVRRPRDGWHWKTQSPFPPPVNVSCSSPESRWPDCKSSEPTTPRAAENK
jgi:Family of unknown function (DUF6152)